jgi:molecular chaperone DnaK (HSP70)
LIKRTKPPEPPQKGIKKAIDRNATIQNRKSKTFSTAPDNQPGIEVRGEVVDEGKHRVSVTFLREDAAV